jgi:hypothetical protein
MLDVAVAYNRYRFLGNEFLTWLWYLVENQPERFQRFLDEPATVEIGNRMVLENRLNENVETITIKGDDADLEEALLALRKGALVTELNLVFRIGEHQWQFNLKGESINISGLKTPETAAAETPEDMEGWVLEKIYLYEKAVSLVENTFSEFARLRTATDWAQKWHPLLVRWIAGKP